MLVRTLLYFLTESSSEADCEYPLDKKESSLYAQNTKVALCRLCILCYTEI